MNFASKPTDTLLQTQILTMVNREEYHTPRSHGVTDPRSKIIRKKRGRLNHLPFFLNRKTD